MATTTVGTVQYDVRLNLSQLKSDISQAEKMVNDSSNKMESSQSKLDRSINNTSKSLNASRVSMLAMGAAAGVAAVGVTALSRSIRENLDAAIARSDTLANFPLVMSNLKISTEESRVSIDILAESLKGLPTSLDAAAQSVQRLTSVNRDVKASTALFLGFNNAILAGGASAHIQATAIQQLSEAYAKGKPDFVEWRALMNAMPAQLQQVAEAMNMVSSYQLGDALRTGKTSMDDFLLTIARLNTEGVNGYLSFEQQARNATGGIQTAITNMNTAITRTIEGIIDSIGRENIAGAISGIGTAFEATGKIIGAVLEPIITIIDMITTGLRELAKWLYESIPQIKMMADGFIWAGKALGIIKENTDGASESAKELEGALNDYVPPLRAATDEAAKFAKQLAKIDEQVKKANEDYRYNLAQLVANKNENIARLQETLRAEEKTYNNAYQERLASFNKTQDKEELSHKEKTKALQNQINFLTKYNNAANQQQLSETQFALARENAEYQKSTKLRQDEFDAQTKSASEEYEKRRAENQKKLNAELALLEKHRKDVLSVRGVMLRDEIESLQKSRDEQIKSLRQQATDIKSQLTSAYSTAGKDAAKAFNKAFGAEGIFFDQPTKYDVQKIGGKTYVVPQFATGGFTGRGGATEPAGIVHKGEYVLPQSAVNQSTGLPKEGALGNQTINVSLNLSGVMTSSKSDERAIATRFAKLINETIVAKTGKVGIAGV